MTVSADENNFEKYSIFGNSENQLKLNEFKKNENKLDLVPFLKSCEYDLDWYPPLLETLSEKHKKLVNPNIRPEYKSKKAFQVRHDSRRPQIQYDSEDLSESVEPKNSGKKIEEYEYNPVSPVTNELINTECDKSQADEEQKSAETSKLNDPETIPETSFERRNIKSDNKQLKKGPELASSDQIKNPFERRAFNLMRFWYPLKFKLPYPRKSLLNSYEQKEFIDFHMKFRNRVKVTQSEVKFYKKYLHYKLQIEKERTEFYNYLREYYKAASEDYEFMNNQIEKYVNEMLVFFDGCVNKFERFYTKSYDITLSQLEANNQNKTSLKFEKNLVQLGHLQKVIVPSITEENQPSLVIDYIKMSKRIPLSKKSKILCKIPLNEDPNAEKLALKYNCSIVITNSAFVYLVYNLTYLNSDELKIGIYVKEFNSKDGKKQRVIFIEKPLVDKHMSKREINEKFYKKALMVTLVKQQAASQRHKLGVKFGQKPPVIEPEVNIEPERVLEKLNIDYNIVSNLDSFGVTSTEQVPTSEKPVENLVCKLKEKEVEIPVETQKIKKRNRQSNESDTNIVNSKKTKSNTLSDYEDYGDEDDVYSDDESEDLVIAESNFENAPKTKVIEKPVGEKIFEKDLIEEPEEAPKSPITDNSFINEDFMPKVIPLEKPIENLAPKIEFKELNKKTESTEDKLSLFDLISKLQDKLIEQPVKTQNNQPHSTHQHPSKASQYPVENPRDYEYIDNVHENLSYTLWTLGINSPLKMLVRSSVDGYINTEHSSLNSVVLYSKLEYQPQFGCEKLSTKDYCKMWAKSYLRNFCDVFLCRINVFNNKLISVTKIGYDDLLPKDLDFNPNNTLNHMRNLFENLMQLDSGNYLINKEPNWNKLDILRSVQGHKAGSFDLHFYYNGFIGDQVKKPSYWMPIDPEIYLTYHLKLNRVPCLFEPQFKEFRRDQSSRSPKNQNNPNKGKKKRRKPKQKKIDQTN